MIRQQIAVAMEQNKVPDASTPTFPLDEPLSKLQKGGYIGDYIGDYYRLINGILGVLTMAHIIPIVPLYQPYTTPIVPPLPPQYYPYINPRLPVRFGASVFVNTSQVSICRRVGKYLAL